MRPQCPTILRDRKRGKVHARAFVCIATRRNDESSNIRRPDNAQCSLILPSRCLNDHDDCDVKSIQNACSLVNELNYTGNVYFECSMPCLRDARQIKKNYFITYIKLFHEETYAFEIVGKSLKTIRDRGEHSVRVLTASSGVINAQQLRKRASRFRNSNTL